MLSHKVAAVLGLIFLLMFVSTARPAGAELLTPGGEKHITTGASTLDEPDASGLTPTIAPTLESLASAPTFLHLPLILNRYPPPPRWQYQHGQHQLRSVHFVNATRGWAVGDRGVIVRSDDGGQRWTVQASGTTRDLRAVQFVSTDEGWAIGQAGTILHTNDGGSTWRAQNSPIVVDLTTLSFVDSERGWIGLPDGVLRTTNGGKIWTKTGSGVPAQVIDIQFFNATNGVLLALSGLFSERGRVLITSDGGETWQGTRCDAYFGFNCDKFLALHFADSTFGVAVGGFVNSAQGVSMDGGATWTNIGEQIQFFEGEDVHLADRSNGWMVRSGTYYRTTDGARTWSRFNGPAAYDIQLLSPSVGFAAGYAGVSKTSDGGYNWTTSDRFDASTLRGVSFVDSSNGWAAGSGKIWRTNDGGDTWVLQHNDNSSLNAIDFVNLQRGWVVGNNGKILTTADGGATWNAQTALTNYNLFGVHFVDSSFGWAVGEEISGYNPNGKVWRTTDGGARWSEVGYFSGYEQGGHGKYAVDFVNRSVGYIVGMEVLWGSVHKTTDGGNTWTLKPLGGNLPRLRAVDFISPDEGWAVGDTGLIVHTIDGGNHWETQTSGVTNALYGVKFLDRQTGYVVGSSVILKTVNGGLTWMPEDAGLNGTAYGVDFADANHGWVVGGSGMILGLK